MNRKEFVYEQLQQQKPFDVTCFNIVEKIFAIILNPLTKHVPTSETENWKDFFKPLLLTSQSLLQLQRTLVMFEVIKDFCSFMK